MKEWERPVFEQIDRLLEEDRVTIGSANSRIAELERRIGIAAVVGDPNHRPSLAPYKIQLALLERLFQTTRQRAWSNIKNSGGWKKLLPVFLKECSRGYNAFFWLHLAGWLYQARVSHLVDVRKHEATIRSLFPNPLTAE